MQFIFNEDSNLYGYAGGNRDFEFPSNIKQMGCIEDGIKIYMEDYVYTYLYQYAKSGNGQERLAALAGRHMIVDGQEIVVISGAIQGRQTIQEKGVESFSEETWQYINSQMDVYFKDLALVGWVHTQPGFGAFLMARDENFHKEYFPEKWQLLFVIDPLDKLDTFFVHNEEATGLRPAKGYFIYYEKNKEMQEYMIDNSLVRPKVIGEEPEQNEEREAKVPGEEVKEKRKPTQEERLDAAKDIRRVLKKRAKEAEEENKTKYTVLAGVSSILCLVCLLMGMSMLNNVERLKRLETQLASVQSSYVTMAQELANTKTQTVFAAQEPATPLKTETSGEPPQKIEDTEEPPKIAEAEPPKEQEMELYVVEEGDNLGFISNKFYGTSKKVELIMDANGLDNPDKIICGQALKIPKQ